MTTNERHIGNLIATMWREFVDPTRDTPLVQSIHDHYGDPQHGILLDYEGTGRHPS